MNGPERQPTNALVIFAKAPIPGQVKTRLCPPLTPDEAATLHGSFVLDQLERTKAALAKHRPPVDRYVACAPASSHVFFKILEERHGVRLLDQSGDDLGRRMERAFAELFGRGYARICLVGTDVPTLPIAAYREAYEVLATHDLVLGPALDGGYYLIGLNKPAPALFDDVPWSGGHVRAITERKAESLGLRVGLLPAWRDVDTIQDLHALIEDGRADERKPKQDRTFSSRTAGTLQLLAKRLQTRRGDSHTA